MSEWPTQNFSLQFQYSIKQTSEENKENYQWGDNQLIQYQILQTYVLRIVQQIVRRITKKSDLTTEGVKRFSAFQVLTLFLLNSCRSATPTSAFFIMNRLSMKNTMEPITNTMEFKLQDPFLLYRNSASEYAMCTMTFWKKERWSMLQKSYNKTDEFISAGVNMFWAWLRVIIVLKPFGKN